ncbi:MAG TPA: immunoglobulin domain-containing protein, partial [Bryobacteraceae bacterium]|nr:immunoglobulin domain-containing protein [Bryobacteraceae bacterium]
IIPGATGSSYTTPALVYGNTYSYHVVVNNSVGSATSSAAAITVTAAPPNILIHPQNALVDEHAMATFTVTAAGTDLSYSWKRDGIPLGGTNSPSYSRQAELSEVGIPFAVAVTGPGGTANSLTAKMDILTHDSFYHQTATPAGAVPGFWLDLGRAYRWQCHRINVHTLTDPNNVRTYGLTVAALDADNVVTAYVVLGSSRLSVYSMTAPNDSVRSDDMTADNIIVPAYGRLIVYCDTGDYRLLGNTTIGSGISPMTAKVYNARPSSIYIGAVLPPFDAGYPASAKWNV